MQVDLSGSLIDMELAGTVGPTVVFEAGAGMGKATWDPIWAEVASFTTVFRYDRPGLGESARYDGRPRTAGDVADQLHDLLRLAGAPGPFALVGHSFGGLSEVPLAVVSRSVPATEVDLGRLRPDLPMDVARTLEETWQALQRDLCAPGSLHLVARRAGHAVHQDDSALVVQAIRAVFTS